MERSFDEVFEAELVRLHRYLARRLDSATADDLAAETFAVALRRWADLDSRPVRPWLYGIAENLVKHHWRKERRMLRALARAGPDPTFEDADVSAERLDAQAAKADLAAALEDLRAVERKVLLLHAWAELSDSEIADALSLPLGTVKSHLSRGRDHLRNRLGGIGKEGVERSLHTAEEIRR
jgi:RNA polymerase sigma-70 factor, ECF subfamily